MTGRQNSRRNTILINIHGKEKQAVTSHCSDTFKQAILIGNLDDLTSDLGLNSPQFAALWILGLCLEPTLQSSAQATQMMARLECRFPQGWRAAHGEGAALKCHVGHPEQDGTQGPGEQGAAPSCRRWIFKGSLMHKDNSCQQHLGTWKQIHFYYFSFTWVYLEKPSRHLYHLQEYTC